MNTSRDRISVGVAGLGGFGRQHLATWASIPSAHLAALCDVRPEALRELGDLYGVLRRYAGFSDLLADPGLDAIDIVTPAPLHEEQALAALASGRHVFCEKPLAETADGAQRVVDAAERAGLRLQVGLVSRFAVPYALIKQQLDAGAFGELVTIRSKRNLPQGWATAFQDTHPVFEAGIHDIDLLVWYAARPCRSVYALERNHLGFRVPDSWSALLSFERGLLAQVEGHWHVPAGAPTGLMGAWDVGGIIDHELELVGTRQIAKFSLANPGLEFWSGQRAYHPEIHLFPQVHGQSAGAIRDELAHFAATVRLGEPSAVAPPQDSVAAIRIAEAILRSAHREEVEHLGSS